MVLTSRERREIFRDAVLGWIAPFLVALSMVDFAISNFFKAASLDFSLIASLTSLMIFLTLVFVDLLRRRRASFWPARLIADL